MASIFRIIHLEDEFEKAARLPTQFAMKLRFEFYKQQESVKIVSDSDELVDPHWRVTHDLLRRNQECSVIYEILGEKDFRDRLEGHDKDHIIIFALLDWYHHDEKISYDFYDKFLCGPTDFDWVFWTAFQHDVRDAIPEIDPAERIVAKEQGPSELADRIVEAVKVSLENLDDRQS